MSNSAYRILVLLTAFLQTAYGLYGPNVCSEQQNYTMTTRVKYQQPISVTTYRWCLGIPPRCPSVHIEMKERWKEQKVLRTKTVELCCEGFEEDEERCVPKCPAGFTGDLCDQGCPLEKWGPSCTEDCDCPDNSICNVKNGSCICLEGWYGSSCNLPLLPATRMPFPRIDKEILKNTHLFDWNPPTMADVQPTEKHVTYRNFILTSAPKIEPISTSTEKNSTKNVNNNNTTTKRPIVVTNRYNVTATKSVLTTTEKNITTTNAPIRKPVNDTTVRMLNVVNITTEVPKTVSTLTPSIEVSTNKTVNIIASMNNATTEGKIYVPTAPVQINTTNKIDVKKENVTTTNIKSIILQTENKIVNMDKNTSTTTVKIVKIENSTETVDDKRITLKTNHTLTSQIESPNSVTLAITTPSPDIKTTENIVNNVSDETTQTNSKISTSTTKRKPIKHHKSESDILNITLHTLVSKNDTGSKIFKTITLPPVSNTTLKMPHQKGKIYHESKMITIPVRVIVDSDKSPSNIYLRKGVNGSKTELRKTGKFVTSYPMFTLDVQTEETKHVLTEPEQITSIAGSEDDFENREDLLSILTISIGVMLIIILTATIIVLVTRYRQIKADKMKDNMEMDHVQSMMNVSEDEVQSGYLRSVFHSPLPDPPSQIIAITKPAFSTPFIQPTLSRPVSPALMESFRDILECHYDHPKPPRPTSTPMRIQISNYQVPPSMYQHLNTFRTSTVGANQTKAVKSDDVSLPVTDDAINVLKLEHQSSQTVRQENREPVYDEIPPWINEVPRNINKIMYSNDEAFTEL